MTTMLRDQRLAVSSQKTFFSDFRLPDALRCLGLCSHTAVTRHQKGMKGKKGKAGGRGRGAKVMSSMDFIKVGHRVVVSLSNVGDTPEQSPPVRFPARKTRDDFALPHQEPIFCDKPFSKTLPMPPQIPCCLKPCIACQLPKIRGIPRGSVPLSDEVAQLHSVAGFRLYHR